MKNKLMTKVNTDLKRYGYENKFQKAFLKIPGFRYVFYLRLTQYHRKNKLIYSFLKLYARQMSYKYGIDMYDTVKIGKGFYIGHFGGIVINGAVEFGDNINISQGVTIGRVANGKKAGAPKIGNSVWIGANAIIVGNVKIGNNSLISPGAFVNFDVPSNTLVMGNPGKIIKQDYENNLVNNKS